MSEEELRAIEFLEGVCTDDCVNKEFVVKPILYLIEKQQKELEQEKEKNKELEKLVFQFSQERDKLLKTPVISKDKIEKVIDTFEHKQCLASGCWDSDASRVWTTAIEILQEELEV